MKKWLNTISQLLITIIAWAGGLLFFVPFGLIFLFLTLFINPRRLDGFLKAGCRQVVRMFFIRVQLEGLENVEKERTFLFLGNHVNLFDPFIFKGYVPGYTRGVELDEHFSWPFYGNIIRRAGTIPISHTNARTALASLSRAQEALAEGTSIIILPEGGRTLNGSFKPFKRGSFMLAKNAGVDMIPVVMKGAYNINQKGSLKIQPGKMTLLFGEPIPYSSMKDLNVNEIRTQIHKIMFEMFTS